MYVNYPFIKPENESLNYKYLFSQLSSCIVRIFLSAKMYDFSSDEIVQKAVI